MKEIASLKRRGTRSQETLRRIDSEASRIIASQSPVKGRDKKLVGIVIIWFAFEISYFSVYAAVSLE